MNKLTIRKHIYAFGAFLNKFLPAHNPHIFILCYHDLSPAPWRFSITLKSFKTQMEFLLQTYRPVSVSEIAQHIEGSKPLTTPSFAVMFDDGYKSIISAVPICKKLGIIPTVGVIAEPNHANRQEMDNDLPLLTKEDLFMLRRAGWGFASHSSTHANLAATQEPFLQKEIYDSKQRLEKIISSPVKYFVYPKGEYTDTTLDHINRAGYSYAFTMKDGFINPKTNRFLIPRIGVDGSHTFEEFTALMLPASIYIRGLLRRLPFANTL